MGFDQEAFAAADAITHKVRTIITLSNVFACFGLWLAFKMLQAFWNVSPLHPLSRIPGPPLAAATYLPEFYYNVIKGGFYSAEISKMHAKYGPIVRINPDEVHCNDAQFVDEIYAVGGRRRDKSQHQVSGLTIPHSTFATTDHEKHRLRRAPLAKFFTRQQIGKLEPVVENLVQRLCDKLLAQRNETEPIDVTMAYSCFTADTISDYMFGHSFGFLAQERWEPNFRTPLNALLETTHLFRFFPFLKSMAFAATALIDFLPPDMALIVRTLNVDIPSQVRQTMADVDAGITRDRPTVFASLLTSDLDESEKSLRRLADEAASIIGAGTETTSWTLAVMTYHLFTQPDLLVRLTEEVSSAVNDPLHLPTWTTLEKLPFLTAVINEGLRLSYGVAARTARVPVDEDLLYKGEWTPPGSTSSIPLNYLIPRGYAIGMSPVISHHDEGTFTDSHNFDPDRWLVEDAQKRKDLSHGLISFSKGSRGCLGMNLAFCELYLSLAALVLRVFPHMQLFETTQRDVAFHHELFTPMVEPGSRGVRVLMV